MKLDAPQPPDVIMIVGVNGSGKTTTVGKLCRFFSEQGRRVVLVDDFCVSGKSWEMARAQLPAGVEVLPFRVPHQTHDVSLGLRVGYRCLFQDGCDNAVDKAVIDLDR